VLPPARAGSLHRREAVAEAGFAQGQLSAESSHPHCYPKTSVHR
jgi:hypothetical protein